MTEFVLDLTKKTKSEGIQLYDEDHQKLGSKTITFYKAIYKSRKKNSAIKCEIQFSFEPPPQIKIIVENIGEFEPKITSGLV